MMSSSGRDPLLTTRIQLCGEFHATVAGRNVTPLIHDGQERALFAFLCLHRDHPMARRQLIDALWSSPPVAADRGLAVLLSRLRSSLGSEQIEGRSTVRLGLTPDAEVDVEVARAAIHRAEAQVRSQDWTSAWVSARIARNAARRHLLPGCDLPWVEVERRRLRTILGRSWECIGEVGLGLGGAEIASTLRAAEELMEAEPLRESAYRLAIRAHIARGNHAEALALYSVLRQRLREQLGTEPGPDSQAVYAQILRQTG